MLLFWIYSLWIYSLLIYSLIISVVVIVLDLFSLNAVIATALYIYHQSDQSSINSFVHNSFKREDGTIRYAIILIKGNCGYFTIPLTTDENDKYTVGILVPVYLRQGISGWTHSY